MKITNMTKITRIWKIERITKLTKITQTIKIMNISKLQKLRLFRKLRILQILQKLMEIKKNFKKCKNYKNGTNYPIPHSKFRNFHVPSSPNKHPCYRKYPPPPHPQNNENLIPSKLRTSACFSSGCARRRERWRVWDIARRVFCSHWGERGE